MSTWSFFNDVNIYSNICCFIEEGTNGLLCLFLNKYTPQSCCKRYLALTIYHYLILMVPYHPSFELWLLTNINTSITVLPNKFTLPSTLQLGDQLLSFNTTLSLVHGCDYLPPCFHECFLDYDLIQSNNSLPMILILIIHPPQPPLPTNNFTFSPLLILLLPSLPYI